MNQANNPGTGVQISTRSIEAAMVAQILKDAMDPLADPKIVDVLVWEKDDGLKENLTIRVHPSFPNESVAFRRVNERIESWITGGKPPVDKNAIFRLVGKAGVFWDISMESFEKAVLSDDGLLAIGLGRANGMVKEPMNLMGSMRLRLYKSDGSSVSRKECLDLIRRAMQFKKKEKMQAAREIAKQEDEIVREQKVLKQHQINQVQEKEEVRVNENGPVKALVQQLKDKDDKKWVQESPLLNEKSNGIQSEINEFLEPPPAEENQKPKGPQVTQAVMIASASQFKVMGQKNQGKEIAQETSNKKEVQANKDEALAEQEDQELQWDVMNVSSGMQAFEANLPIEKVEQKESKNEGPSLESVKAMSSIQIQTKSHPAQENQGKESITANENALKNKDVVGVAQEKEIKNKIQMNWVRDVFPALPEGWDEILIAIQADRWNELMEVLHPLESFELRVIAKEVGVWTVGLAIPCECFKQTTPLFVQFATGGVMFKRAKKFTNA